MKKTKLLWLISKYPNTLNAMDGVFHKNMADFTLLFTLCVIFALSTTSNF